METSPQIPQRRGIDAVLDRFCETFMHENRDWLQAVQRRAITAMMRCRTRSMGGSIYKCTACNTYDYSYHSCGHRACPKCSHLKNEAWHQARSAELLPVDYLQVVVALPPQLRGPIYQHQRKLYSAFMKAVARSAQRFFLKRYGVKVAVMAVLHTWARDLSYHPHVHLVITAGGLTADGDFKPVHVDPKAMARLIEERVRPMFLREARRVVDGLQLPGHLDLQKWHVFVSEARQDAQPLVRYLARFVHQTALTDRSILAIEGDTVRIQYTPSGTTESQTMSLHGHELLRRLLRHVPAKGFHRVRYYGLWSPAQRKHLKALKMRMEAAKPDATAPTTTPKTSIPAWRTCPHCGNGVMETLEDFKWPFDPERYVQEKNARPPPLQLCAA